MIMTDLAIDLMHDVTVLAPEIFLACSAMFLLVLGAFRGNGATALILMLAVLTILMTAGQIISDPTLWSRQLAFSDFFVTDAFASTMKIVCLIGLAAALGISLTPLRHDMMLRFEYPILVVLSGVGMMLMMSANDMLSVYVGLELSSLALYVLAAFRRETSISAEAGMKYFILGALSSGMLLFGISLVYGFIGSTNFDQINHVVGATDGMQAGVIVGMAFILAGIAFKISAVPFHMWTPDVYEGAPSAVTALFAMVPKIAALALLTRLLFGPFAALENDWVQIIAFLALASMIWSAFGAIAQRNVKRLLAYSSIGNIGYALVGLIAGGETGVAATLMYMMIYLAMTAGTFAVLLTIRRDNTMIEDMDDFAGLSRTQPLAAYALATMLFAMSGLPPLAGFFGKLMVFQTAVAAGFYTLAVVGVISSVVAAYYYLRLIRVMFFDKPTETMDSKPDIMQQLVLLIALLFVIGFVINPDAVYAVAHTAAQALFVPKP
jgi:NADH-quinone oxidoreductase subunit N